VEANAAAVLDLFETKMQIEVPLFQRQYVWDRQRHWEPLWEDISHKFAEYIEGRRDAPSHFLGAMVLDQKRTPSTHVTRRQVIDGQQRLTTLQIFLAALRDFCKEQGCADIAEECEAFTLNRGMMSNPDIDRFKVQPTQADRKQFRDVLQAGSRTQLEQLHPPVRRKYARKNDPRPKMVEAYLFFHEQLAEFFLGTSEEPPLAVEYPLSTRLDECFQALKNALQVVVIDLGVDDDAQVIFETLNARGEPLLPADLLRNFIFLRAARLDEPQEELYEEHWRPFDDDFWRTPIRQGRLLRPRSDLFLQHFLASREGRDIPIGHLFVEYRHWINTRSPFGTVREELAVLARQRDDFRRIIDPHRDDPLFTTSQFLEAFEVSTVYPLLLAMLDAKPSRDELTEMGRVIESYLIRRAVVGLTTKNYNRLFLQATRALQQSEFTTRALTQQLGSGGGDSTGWPSDDEFREAWMTQHIYRVMNNPKLVHVLKRLSDAFLDNKSERVTVEGPLTVEHLLPQSWLDHWPLQEGSRGMTADELNAASGDDPRAEATRKRNEVLHTIGNLTILPPGANSWVSNASWEEKRPKILSKSLLPINAGSLFDAQTWDENAIEVRGKALFEKALRIWPRPTN
jgi:hypothetical protein